MKWIVVILLMGFIMANDKINNQTDLILETKQNSTLPVRTNNWMSVQGKDKWVGLSNNQIHKRQLNFVEPEYGIRAGAISLITKAVNRNKKPEINISQIFFEDNAWAEDKESYKLNAISKGFSDSDTFDLMDRDSLKSIVKFITNHEMGTVDYNNLKDKDKIIDRGIDMAYDYVLSDDYSLKEFIK